MPRADMPNGTPTLSEDIPKSPNPQILAIIGSPGLSLGVLRQGNIAHTAHFGRRDCSDPVPPNDDTVYRVASLTKVLTSSTVALLVDKGILSWDTLIREYFPTFGQRSDELGQKATLKDLLANLIGLAVADFLWGQRYGEFLLPRSELVRTTIFLEAVKPFRKKFFYTRWNYGLVTEVVEAVTGKMLGSYIKEKTLDPMEMRRPRWEKQRAKKLQLAMPSARMVVPVRLGFRIWMMVLALRVDMRASPASETFFACIRGSFTQRRINHRQAWIQLLGHRPNTPGRCSSLTFR